MRIGHSLALILVLGLLAGCGGAQQAPIAGPHVVMEALKFTPAQMEVQLGQPITLAIVNQDRNLHDWTIGQIPVKDKQELSVGEGHEHGGGVQYDLHVSVKGGKTGSVTFTPTEAGTYNYVCTVPGHKEAGMVGTLVVK